jgi:AcrR family transcriptional regulator
MSETGQTRRSVHKKVLIRRPTASPRFDRRAARTRNALLRALHSLTEEKDYLAITVGEIAEAANVGRSTFYAHFMGKDDLLRFGIARLGEHFAEWQRQAVVKGEDSAGDPLAFSLFMFRFFEHWPALSRAITRGQARKLVFEHVRQLLTGVLRQNLKAWPAKGAIPRELAVQHTIGAFMAVFFWWLERGAKETPDAIDAAFRRLVMAGIDGVT